VLFLKESIECGVEKDQEKMTWKDVCITSPTTTTKRDARGRKGQQKPRAVNRGGCGCGCVDASSSRSRQADEFRNKP
jgi:hypothetical protein